LEQVKVKFYKGKGAVRGSGIGLAVVDEILKAHNGGLTLNSQLGQGTTVTARLPLYRREGAPPA
jgi:signal transduction histidine kinase